MPHTFTGRVFLVPYAIGTRPDQTVSVITLTRPVSATFGVPATSIIAGMMLKRLLSGGVCYLFAVPALPRRPVRAELTSGLLDLGYRLRLFPNQSDELVQFCLWAAVPRIPLFPRLIRRELAASQQVRTWLWCRTAQQYGSIAVRACVPARLL